MKQFTDATWRALAFLTRLPPSRRAFTGTHPLGEDVHAFPLAGLLATLPAVVVLWIATSLGLTSLVSACLAVATQIAATGALHEDGLGDVADGLGGHHEKTRALAIMKDSRLGSYGALALILSVAIRIALVAALIDRSPLGTAPETAALALLAVAAGSRGAMAGLWSSLPSADPGGLADSVGQPDKAKGRAALAIGLAVYALGGVFACGAGSTLAGFVLSALALLWFRKTLIRRLGGQTGDTIGAAQQLVEIAALLGLAVPLG